MAADHDRIGPAGHQARHIVDHDRLAEDDAAQNVADGAIRADPHFLEVEFLDARLVGRDRGAFHADAVLLDRVGGIDGDLVVGFVALLDRKIVIFQVDIEIRQDQSFADPLPDDFRHLVAVEFDDRVLDLDFRHVGCGPYRCVSVLRRALAEGGARAREGADATAGHTGNISSISAGGVSRCSASRRATKGRWPIHSSLDAQRSRKSARSARRVRSVPCGRPSLATS